MQVNSFLLLVILAFAPFCTALGSCSDKFLFEDDGTLIDTNTDKTLAYHESASCATLSPDSEDDGLLCCYIKIKFKNKELDETFTQKGCVEIDISDTLTGEDFDTLVDEVEKNIGTYNNVDVKKFSIDCSSKYLHLAGILILFFLL